MHGKKSFSLDLLNQPIINKVTIIGKVRCEVIFTKAEVVDFDDKKICPSKTKKLFTTSPRFRTTVASTTIPLTSLSPITKLLSSTFSKKSITSTNSFIMFLSSLKPPILIPPTTSTNTNFPTSTPSIITLFPTKLSKTFPSTMSHFQTKLTTLSNTIITNTNNGKHTYPYTHQLTKRTSGGNQYDGMFTEYSNKTRDNDLNTTQNSNLQPSETEDEFTGLVIGLTLCIIVIITGTIVWILRRIRRNGSYTIPDNLPNLKTPKREINEETIPKSLGFEVHSEFEEEDEDDEIFGYRPYTDTPKQDTPAILELSPMTPHPSSSTEAKSTPKGGYNLRNKVTKPKRLSF